MAVSLDGHHSRGNKIPRGAWVSGLSAADTENTRGDVARKSDGSFTILLSEFALSNDEVARMERCLQTVQAVVNRGLGPEWSVEKFGSVPNGFGTRGSDIDLTVVSAKSKEDCDGPVAVERLRDRLQPMLQEQSGFAVVQEIYGAKVPILKLRFEECLEVDISYQNVRALRNTRLLKAYASLDPAVQGLVIAVKLWAKSAGVCGAAERNLSSYAFTLMVIYYLQVDLDMPCLPPDAFECQGLGSEDPRVAMMMSWQASAPCASSLVWGFFRFYASVFAWGREVVSVRLGRRSSRGDDRFKRLPHRSVARIHIEDPYELDRNLHCVLGSEQEEKLIAAVRKASAGSERGVPPVGLGRLWGNPPAAPPRVRATDFPPPTPPHTPQTLPSASPPLPPPLHSVATAAGGAGVHRNGEGLVAEQPAAAGLQKPSALDDATVSRGAEVLASTALLSTTPIASARSPPSPGPTRREAPADRGILSSPAYYAGTPERSPGPCAAAAVEQPQHVREGAAEADSDAHNGDEGAAAVSTLRWLEHELPNAVQPPGEASAASARSGDLGKSSSSSLSDFGGVSRRRGSGSSQRSGAKRAGSSSSTCAADSGSGASVGAQTDSEDTTCTAFDSGSTHDSGAGGSVSSGAPLAAAQPQPPMAGIKWWLNMDSQRVQMDVEKAMAARKATGAAPPRSVATEAKVLEELRAGPAADAVAAAPPAVGNSLAIGGRPLRKSTAAILQNTQKVCRAVVEGGGRPAPGAILLQ